MPDKGLTVEQLAALLCKTAPFAPVYDDTASPTQRTLDRMETEQRAASARAVANFLLSRLSVEDKKP